MRALASWSGPIIIPRHSFAERVSLARKRGLVKKMGVNWAIAVAVVAGGGGAGTAGRCGSWCLVPPPGWSGGNTDDLAQFSCGLLTLEIWFWWV